MRLKANARFRNVRVGDRFQIADVLPPYAVGDDVYEAKLVQPTHRGYVKVTYGAGHHILHGSNPVYISPRA